MSHSPPPSVCFGIDQISYVWFLVITREREAGRVYIRNIPKHQPQNWLSGSMTGSCTFSVTEKGHGMLKQILLCFSSKRLAWHLISWSLPSNQVLFTWHLGISKAAGLSICRITGPGYEQWPVLNLLWPLSFQHPMKCVAPYPLGKKLSMALLKSPT